MIALYVRSHPTQNAWKDNIAIHAKKTQPVIVSYSCPGNEKSLRIGFRIIHYIPIRQEISTSPAHQLFAAPSPRLSLSARPQLPALSLSVHHLCSVSICPAGAAAAAAVGWRLHSRSIHQPGRRPQRACWPRSHQRPLGVSHASTGPRRAAVTHLAVSGVHVLPECRSCESGVGEVVQSV